MLARATRRPDPVRPARPAPVFRVGITGARKPADGIARLRDRVQEVFDLIEGELAHLANQKDARDAYAPAADGKLRPRIVVLSPLAEGADRLVAEVARDRGHGLYVPMPFARETYRRDFAETPGSADDFDRLAAYAGPGLLELDGARDDIAARRYDQARSYEAVGRHVVHNCDLLIAIWDGGPPRGRGGTFDTVRHATETGVPVWWIDSHDPAAAPVWLDEMTEPRTSPGARPACAALSAYMRRLILPPEAGHPHRHSFLERIVDAVRGRQPPPHLFYLDSRVPHRSARIWRTHRWFLAATARFQPAPSDPPRPTDPVAAYWHDCREAAGRRANEYALRYRSVYVLVFGLIALSISLAAMSLAFPHCAWLERVLAPAELACLIGVGWLVGQNIRHDWHERWIDYRLLAELCRKQQALAPMGWSLPGRAVATLVEEESDAHERDRAAWVPWLFGAVMRAAPLPAGAFTGETLKEPLRLAQDDLIDNQRRYHEGRRTQYSRAGTLLVRTGEALFFAVVLLAGWKTWHILTLHHTDAAHGAPAQPSPLMTLVGLACVILPTVASAMVGVRAYAELQLLATQSRHMAAIMERASARLESLKARLDEPLASQELGTVTHVVATNMLQEVDGWARMFRMKVVEAS